MNTFSPIDENGVVEAVACELQRKGYTIVSTCSTIQAGVDIVALDTSKKRWLVEAKGETSSQKRSKKFGNPFDDSQISVHVARAFYQAAKLRAKNPADGIIIALPNEERHRRRIGAIAQPLKKLEIDVVLVSRDGAVDWMQ